MKYLLIKDYNPAYDFWIRAHLKQDRIMGDREYSWKEVQQISIDMSARGVEDKFFQSYFRFWRDHPEHPPDYFDLLRMIFPIYKDEKPIWPYWHISMEKREGEVKDSCSQSKMRQMISTSSTTDFSPRPWRGIWKWALRGTSSQDISNGKSTQEYLT